MSDSSDKSSPDAFEDILFSSSGEGDNSSKGNVDEPQAESTAQSTMSFDVDESFDDILFDDDSAQKALDAAKQERLQKEKAQASQAAEQLAAAKAADAAKRQSEHQALLRKQQLAALKAKQSASEQKAPPAIPTTPTPVVNAQREEAPSLSMESDGADACGQMMAIEEPVADDSFLEGALFDDELALDEATAMPAAVAEPAIAEEEEETELMKDALFSNDEDFEAATDMHPDEFAKKVAKPKVKKSAVKEAEAEVIPPININYEQFVSRASLANAFVGKKSALQKQLIAENDAVNGSFPLVEVEPKSAQERPVIEQTEQVEAEADTPDVANKVKFFARKAKGNVNEFLGGEMPEREIPLDFKFPQQKGKKELGEAPTKREILNYLEKKGATLSTLLKRAEHDLVLISKYQLSGSDRERLLQAFLPMFYEKIPQLIASFERKPFDPKNVERFEQLQWGMEGLRCLIAGFKQVYLDYYEMNSFNYKRKRDEANNCAYELVQLLSLEQRLFMATKLPLQASSIKALNKVALIIQKYEPEFFQAVQPHSLNTKARSVATLWKKYSLFQCFDHLAISSRLNKALSDYIDYYLLDKTTWLACEDIAYSSSSQCLAINDGLDRRAPLLQFEELEPAAINTIVQEHAAKGNLAALLAVDSLFNQIKHDFQDCYLLLTGAKQSHACESIAELSKEDALSFFAYLNDELDQLEQNNKKPFYSIYTACEMEVHAGLDQIYDFYHELYQQYQDELSGPQGGPEKRRRDFGQKGWGIAAEDEQYIYLQGQLQPNMPYLDCGEVIVISRSQDDGSYHHQLAIIKELNLSKLNQPQLVAQKVAGDVAALFEAQGFEPNHDQQGMEQYPALNKGLLSYQGDQHFLLASSKEALFSDQLLRVCLGDQHYIVKLHHLYYVSPAAMLFSLS